MAGPDLNAPTPNLQIKGSTGVPTNLKLNQYILYECKIFNRRPML